MKQLLISGLMAVSITFTACKKEPLKLLPDATQEGLNTLGCIIDGEPYYTHHNPEPSTEFNCRPKCYYW